MTNYLYAVLLCLITLNSCGQENKINEITYTANSRGFFEEVHVTNDSFTIKKSRDVDAVKSYALSGKQKSDLQEALRAISVENLNKLAVPSDAHTYDGAAMATLKVKKGDSTLETRVFDHGNPPKQISGLVNILLTLEKK